MIRISEWCKSFLVDVPLKFVVPKTGSPHFYLGKRQTLGYVRVEPAQGNLATLCACARNGDLLPRHVPQPLHLFILVVAMTLLAPAFLVLGFEVDELE